MSADLAPAFLDELRARVAVSTVVGRRVKLTPRRARDEGLLPVPQREVAQLFRQRRQGLLPLLRLRRARRRDPLRRRAGGARLHRRGQVARAGGGARASRGRRREARERTAAANSLHDVTRRRRRCSPTQLRGTAARRARDYLGTARITPRRVAAFGLGFAPDSRARAPDSARAASARRELIEAGLLIASRRTSATPTTASAAG